MPGVIGLLGLLIFLRSLVKFPDDGGDNIGAAILELSLKMLVVCCITDSLLGGGLKEFCDII